MLIIQHSNNSWRSQQKHEVFDVFTIQFMVRFSNFKLSEKRSKPPNYIFSLFVNLMTGSFCNSEIL